MVFCPLNIKEQRILHWPSFGPMQKNIHFFYDFYSIKFQTFAKFCQI